jgi:hypothetical protein
VTALGCTYRGQAPDAADLGPCPPDWSHALRVVWQARAMTLGSGASGDEGPAGRRVRSRVERRDALVRSALTTLGGLGETATMEDLAVGMGVNKAALSATSAIAPVTLQPTVTVAAPADLTSLGGVRPAPRPPDTPLAEWAVRHRRCEVRVGGNQPARELLWRLA